MCNSVKLLKGFWGFVKKNDNKRMATQPFPTGITEYDNLAYREDTDPFHTLDIYRLEGVEGKLPVIIDVHGGGWMYGTKELNKNYCLHLTKRGFAVVNMSYHLFPDVCMPEPIQDIFAAFNYVLSVGEQYGLDLDRVYLTGDSAGAHYSAIALSVLADPALAELYGVQSDISIKAVGFTCGAFSTESIAKIKVPVAQCYARLFVGQKDYKSSPYWASLNIKNNKVDKFPPMFLCTCDGDFIGSQTKAFIALLDEKKIPYVYHYATQEKGGNKMQHVYPVLYPEWKESVDNINAMTGFFAQHA